MSGVDRPAGSDLSQGPATVSQSWAVAAQVSALDCRAFEELLMAESSVTQQWGSAGQGADGERPDWPIGRGVDTPAGLSAEASAESPEETSAETLEETHAETEIEAFAAGPGEKGIGLGGSSSNDALTEAISPVAPEEMTLFSLLGDRANAIQGVAQTTPAATLTRELCDVAQRMLISDGSHGLRQVQVQIKDAVLPGVVVSVTEQQGGVVFGFQCTQAGSRRRLETWSRRMSDELGRALGRQVRVSVQGVDAVDSAGTSP